MFWEFLKHSFNELKTNLGWLFSLMLNIYRGAIVIALVLWLIFIPFGVLFGTLPKIFLWLELGGIAVYYVVKRYRAFCKEYTKKDDK